MSENSNFENFLIENKVVGYKTEPITLKSGKLSNWYANCRILSQKLNLLETSAKFVLEFLENNYLLLDNLDAVLGVPEGANELGQALQRELIRQNKIQDKIYSFRIKPKDHGDIANKYWINGNVPSKVLVLEDVTTTGGSAITFVKKLQEMGIEVVGVISLINRLQLDNGLMVEVNFQKANIFYLAMTDAQKLLNHLLKNTESENEFELIRNTMNAEYKKEYAEYNLISPVKLLRNLKPREIEKIGFREVLKLRQEKIKSCLCVGLDPLPEKLPKIFEIIDEDTENLAKNITAWMIEIVKATAEYTSMFKFQRAHWEAFLLGEAAMRQVIDYIYENYPDIPVFLDCKRGDIDRTQARYGLAHFIIDKVDGMNYSPYMGDECLTGLVESSLGWKSIVVLGRTSNPGSKNVQELILENQSQLWEKVVADNFNLAKEYKVDRDFGVVMAAAFLRDGQIYSSHLSRAREILGEKVWFLIPGIGTQGGLLKETLENAWRGFGSLVISSSSQIIFASQENDFAEAAAREAQKLNQEISKFI